MKFAVHYSVAAADLVRRGNIQIDSFKCPAWPALIPTVQETLTTYVHFPLTVGTGLGDAFDSETKQRADWAKVETLVAQTGTPFINLHLSPTVQDHPDVSLHELQPGQADKLTACLIRDVEAVVKRFGADRVILENDYDEVGGLPKAACLPDVIHQVVTATQCGFLFDLSHARLAAKRLDLDVKAYIKGLPVAQVREIHVTGIQRVEGKWIELLQRGGIPEKTIQRFAGRLMDHLPMTDDDWPFLAWSIAQIRIGQWATPWIIAFEVGGVGPLWADLTESDVLAEQVPRLAKMIKG